MMLKMMGNDTRRAYDGEEAVAAAGEFRPRPWPAEAKWLRSVPSQSEVNQGQGVDHHRPNWVGAGRGPAADTRSWVRLPHGQACGPRRVDEVAGRVATGEAIEVGALPTPPPLDVHARFVGPAYSCPAIPRVAGAVFALNRDGANRLSFAAFWYDKFQQEK